MMTVPPHRITLTLGRTFFEHPEAVHLKRMRMAIWLYLALLSRLPKLADVIEIDPAALATSMGVPEGTIRSWLGHLRKGRYVTVQRRNGSLRVTVKRPVPRLFSVAKLARALGESGNESLLEKALKDHADPLIQRALAGALAVRARDIRRSRTALFIYLLKQYEDED